MKRMQLLALTALVAGLQIAVAQASPFPSSADETSPLLLEGETYAERMARLGDTTGAEVWGVSRRQDIPHDPFPSSGGLVDD